MKAGQFYQIIGQGACIIKLVSKKQWKGKALLAQERHVGESHGFEAKVGEMVYMPTTSQALQTILLGTGDEEVETAVAIAASKLPEGKYVPERPVSNRAAMMWGAAQYRFTRYKKNVLKPRVLCLSKNQLHLVQNELEAIFLVRDLINTPAQDMNPEALEEVAKDLAKKYKATSHVLSGAALLKAGYAAIHTVGRAAEHAPRLIEIKWGKAKHPLVSLVGKGVCFDSGGLDLKPPSGMRTMKKDMAGAAHVLGLAQWIMASELPIRLHVLIPAVENAVAANAYRPGDIITMKNGLTVEVENTDAEGRLILADALVKACEEKPALLLDFSTLTGAARVAVGPDITAMFTPKDKLANDLYEIGEAEHDPM